MAVKDVTDKDFDTEVIEDKGLVVVDMWAPWCTPCRMLSPLLEELSQEYKDIKMVKLNVDENPEVQGRYQVMSIPTVIFVKGGDVVESLIGVQPKDRYEELIKKHTES